MNKKAFFVLFTAALWLFAQADTVAGGLKIYTDAAYATPFPAEPGKYFEVWFKIQNPGFTISSGSCELLPKYPFSLDSGEATTKELGQVLRESYAYVKYRLRVASDAVQGDNELNIRCRTDLDPLWVNATLIIPVKTAQPTLNIDAVSSDPVEARPGSPVKTVVVLKNYAPNTLKDILVKMDTSESTPLAPMGGSSEKRIPSLAGGESAQVVFDSIVLPDAAPKVYRVPVTISYGDELGNAYSKADVLTVVVSDAPRISTRIESTTIIRSGTQGKVNIQIVNEGLAEAKFLRVTLQKSDGFEIVSPADTYLGTLNSDDYETAEFTVFLKQTDAKAIWLPVTVEFTDALNRQHSQASNIQLRLYSEDEINSIGLEQKGGTSIVIIVVVLAVAGYLAYRGYKQFRKK
ncbi:MAG: hypothetical protein NTY90_01355 [Candidatus Micrarchaeota archaeon]|nr:hypothetical protein [Candidatus Micrarchaeota archaeon]